MKSRLFLDRRLIDTTKGVDVTLAPCERHPENPLPLDGKPVWTYGNLTASLYRDADGAYKGWYRRDVVPGEDQSVFDPVESDDGLHWRSAGPAHGEAGSRTILHDARDPDPGRRFKSIHQQFSRPEPDGSATPVSSTEGRRMHRAKEPMLRAMLAQTSGDGREWSDPAPIVHSDPFRPHQWWVPGEPGWEGGDNFPCILWAPDLERYVVYFRTNIFNGVGQRRERAVGRAESADFLTWSEHALALQSRVLWHTALGCERHDFYQFQIWPAGGVYLGIISVFYWDQDRVHLELAWSPDTLNWERICPGEDLIPHGAQGEFDGGCRYAAMSPITVGDEVRVYYGASNGRHNADDTGDSGLCLATFGRDRFAGLTSGRGAGTILTRPVTLSDAPPTLTLNASASRGAVRAALCDEAGATLAGFSRDASVPFTGDALAVPLRWEGADLSALAGRAVRLRLYMDNATVYAVGH